uniref:Nucleophosmin n=1 Tax=Nomascus leucogenys TaxID=61853 RepID=A0A2I3G933_NOMLE
MEDLMDMDMSPLRPQNYLFNDYLKVDNDEDEHQLSLRIVSLGAGAKDELHIVEAEAMNYEGSPIKVTLATLKMSIQPTVSLGGFEITLPVGQHLIAVEEDARKDEEEEGVKLLTISGERSAPGGGSKIPQKKVKLAADEDDDYEDDDDEDEDDDDDFDDKDTKEKAPEKAPKTPKGPSSVEDVKANMQASIEKGGSLPQVEAKFINYVKNCFWMTDQEAIQDL